jgi:hypothetical protein
MTINYLAKRVTADRQIRKWGQAASLRRSSEDRDCWALEVQLSTHEKQSLKNFTDRVFIVSAVDLEEAPTREDALVWEGKVLKQVAPPAPLAPGGVVIYYELQVSGA